VSVGSRSDNGKELHSFGAQAAKLCGPKVEVRQARTCKPPRAAERKWQRLVLTVTLTHPAPGGTLVQVPASAGKAKAGMVHSVSG